MTDERAWVIVVGKGSWAKCHGLFASYDDVIDWAKRNQFTEADAYEVYPLNVIITPASASRATSAPQKPQP